MKIARIVINIVFTVFALIWYGGYLFIPVTKEESIVYSDTIITEVHKDTYKVFIDVGLTTRKPYYFLRSPDDTYFLVRNPNEELQTALTSAEGKTVRIGYSTDYQYAGASEIFHIEIDGVKYLDTRETIEAERQKDLWYFAFAVGLAAILVTVKIILICTKPEC